MKRRTFATGARIAVLFAFHFSLFISTSTAYAVEVDGVVAKVGQDTILRSDVIAEMQRAGVTDERLFVKFRNELIDRRLILKAATESKMTMQDWVVENRIREIVRSAFGGDRNKLIEFLGKQRMSYPEWSEKVKEDLIVGAMRWNTVDKNVSPSPSALRKEYATHPDRYTADHKVSVSVILLKPDEASKRDAIAAELKSRTFEELGGRKYADVNPAEVFKPDVVAEIEKMPKGTISHWIEIDGWSFLLRKDAESTGRKLSFEEAYDKIEEAVRAEESKALYDAWLERLRAETYIRVF